MFKVKAIADGFYGKYRRPSDDPKDFFIVGDKKDISDKWMEVVESPKAKPKTSPKPKAEPKAEEPKADA